MSPQLTPAMLAALERALFVRDRDIRPVGPDDKEVRDYFKRKGLKPGWDWRDVTKLEHDFAFTAAKFMRRDVLKAMREELDRALAEGLTYEQFVENIEPRMRALGWWEPRSVKDPETGKRVLVNPPQRLHKIFSTNCRTARAVGQWDRIERTKKTRPYLLYQVGPSKRHREQHLAWHGLLLPADDDFWSYAFPPNGWGCFLPGTRVTGAFVGGSKAWYAGEAVEIECESGATLAVTPNHPIATSGGWLAAARLEVGMYCVSHAREIELVRAPGAPDASRWAVGDQHVPARLEDVFEALAAHGRRATEVSPLDFHGEAARFVGEVDVVGTYVHLVHERQAALAQLARQAPLSWPDARLPLEQSLSLQDALARGSFATGRSGERWLSERAPLLGRGPLVPFVCRVGAPALLDLAALEKPAEGYARHAAFLSELQHRGAGAVTLDQIVGIRRYPFRGHVYDLESESGWLLAGGLVASNCKCHVRTVSKVEHARLLREGIIEGAPEPILDDEGLPTGHVVQKKTKVRTTAPDVPLVPWQNKRTGKTELVREGIDPGFDKRPGEGRQAALTDDEAPAPKGGRKRKAR